MAESNAKYVSYVELKAKAEEAKVEMPDAIKGLGFNLREGDAFKVKDVVLTRMSGSILDENGNLILEEGKFPKGCYWAALADIKRGDKSLKNQLISCQTLVRGVGAYNCQDPNASERVGNSEFIEKSLVAMAATKKAQEFTLSLYTQESSTSKLLKLVNKTIKVVGSFVGYTKKFNKDKVLGWGNDISHWAKDTILVFDDISNTKAAKAEE